MYPLVPRRRGITNFQQGFLSESIDDFAQTYIYPAYSPLVVFFLLCSSAYGYWKVCLHCCALHKETTLSVRPARNKTIIVRLPGEQTAGAAYAP